MQEPNGSYQIDEGSQYIQNSDKNFVAMAKILVPGI